MNKNDLRKSALLQRQLYTEEVCARMSLKIAGLFFSDPLLDLSSVTYLHIFLPIRHKKEVDTFLIFHKLLEEYPQIRLVLSKSDFSKGTMTHFVFTKEMTLQENVYGIPEPSSGEEIPADRMDMVLVPLVIVDVYGNRIGYGKGFYDRFLANCRPDCKKIGLSFEKPVAQIIPEPFDIPVDFCVTPEKVYAFSGS